MKFKDLICVLKNEVYLIDPEKIKALEVYPFKIPP